MSKLPLITKENLFVDSPEGIVISDETHDWLENVLDTLNYILQTGITRKEKDTKELARLIMAINRESNGCSSRHKK